MDFAAFGNLGDMALLAALASTRFAVAFLLLPVLAQETVPATVRGALFLGFGVITLAVQPLLDVNGLTAQQWLLLFAKEAFLGLAMGAMLAAVLWAFHAAGEIVDGASGMSMAQIVDPLSGRQTSLTGAFLGRLAVFMFMFSGGMLLWVGALMESFALWPLGQMNLLPKREGVVVFEGVFSHFASLMFVLAAPALVMLYTIDLSLGLMNRYAPQLNLLPISSSLKGLAAVLAWVVMLSTVVHTLTEQIGELMPQLLQRLQAMLV